MILGQTDRPRRAGWLVLVATGAFGFGFLDSCDDRLLTLTTYVDPCGTFLTCAPGDFQVQAAEIGDYCIDPACTVAGECGQIGPPLGTITDLCP